MCYKWLDVWMSVAMYGNKWVCMCVYVCKCVWMFVDVSCCVWMCVDVCGCVWMSVDACWCELLCVDVREYLWNGIRAFIILLNFMWRKMKEWSKNCCNKKADWVFKGKTKPGKIFMRLKKWLIEARLEGKWNFRTPSSFDLSSSPLSECCYIIEKYVEASFRGSRCGFNEAFLNV